MDLINRGISPIVDREIEDSLASGELDLHATTDISECRDADYVIVATPTNYDVDKDSFDTSSVDSVIENVTEFNHECTIIVKSTIPIGYTESKYSEGYSNVIFSPEFLREGRALYDNLHPSRIVVGIPAADPVLTDAGNKFAEVLAECSEENDCEIVVMGSTEAESVKLFSNTYLAMRVAFFNELDSFAEVHHLDTSKIIHGVCLDPRIGDYYNNPSFGYGGYCLPKDTKQLLANYRDVPNDIIVAIVRANDTRKRFIADRISAAAGGSGTIGVYRLSMKSGSDNFRESSIIDVIHILRERGSTIQVYEPSLETDSFDGLRVIGSLQEFLGSSDIILANRMDSELMSVRDKVYTRDLFSRD